jgi:hypothetical protein
MFLLMVVLRLVLAENVVVELVVEGIVLGVWGEAFITLCDCS